MGDSMKTKVKDAPLDNVGNIIRYESGELSQQETLELFAGLLRSGLVWQLQGHYGRVAADLINAGYVSAKGEILAK